MVTVFNEGVKPNPYFQKAMTFKMIWSVSAVVERRRIAQKVTGFY